MHGEDDFGPEFELVDADDDGREGTTILFQVGGRVDLPEGFVVQPVRLGSRDELAAAAWAAPKLARLVAFVGWVGEGRQLADDGELSVSDGRELTGILGLEAREWLDDEVGPRPDQAEVWLVIEWAMLAGFVYQRGRKLFRTARGREVATDALATWKAAFEALLELGVIDVDGSGPPWGQTIDRAIPDLIVLANLAGKPIPFGEVLERLWWQEEELLSLDPGDTDMTEGLKEASANDARQMVDALAEIGALGVNGDSLVSTPLGQWAAVELLREDGFDPPTEPESPAPTARDRPST